jgi:hypothetical protein
MVRCLTAADLVTRCGLLAPAGRPRSLTHAARFPFSAAQDRLANVLQRSKSMTVVYGQEMDVVESRLCGCLVDLKRASSLSSRADPAATAGGR